MNGTLGGLHLQIGFTPRDARSDSRRSARGKLVAIELTHASNSQWLDNLITSINLIKIAGGLASFPFLGHVAEIVVQILMIIQVSDCSFALSAVNRRSRSPPTRTDLLPVLY